MSTTAQCYYTAARDEIIMRLRLRDQSLLAYTIASASIIGLSLTNLSNIGTTVALIIPFLSLGAAILISSHSIAITNLGRYTVQLKDAIDKCRKDSGVELEPWDYSSTFINYSEKYAEKRLRSHLVVICIPAIFSLIVTFDKFKYPFDLHSTFWCAGVFMIIYSVLELGGAHIQRIKDITKRINDFRARDKIKKN